MKVFLTILVVLSISVAQGYKESCEYEGLMPGVEVTALRPRPQIEANVGNMPEVTVTAFRYELEDEAWSGLMPEVVIYAVRPVIEPLAHLHKRDVDIHADALQSPVIH